MLLLLVSDLQHRLDLGGHVGLLVQLDALFVGAAAALHRDALQVGQHHAVSLGHRLELIKQQLQQIQEQPAGGARGRGKGGGLETTLLFLLSAKDEAFKVKREHGLVESERGPGSAALATRGLDVEVSVQLINEHQVDVELLAVQLQAQVSEPLHLQQGAFQGLHGGHLHIWRTCLCSMPSIHSFLSSSLLQWSSILQDRRFSFTCRKEERVQIEKAALLRLPVLHVITAGQSPASEKREQKDLAMYSALCKLN
ncbi:hypothetical protein EYF80_040402 [Liparis tanakae]|uniref:Uncharacterized protein n=1 Tax=Liparis tanakae TaxID=230148 RepID=A0A4Z2G8A9_9TELE|nr:hypothetical protein EYF80_040402 [Liparis tanakae]